MFFKLKHQKSNIKMTHQNPRLPNNSFGGQAKIKEKDRQQKVFRS
jgi:hypothetical protein